eukprot:PhF_6_TR8322/c0_g1_i2/m.12946
MSHPATTTSVRAVARIRPFSAAELSLSTDDDQVTSILYAQDNVVTLLDPAKSYSAKEAFMFDECFWSIPATQNQYSGKPFASQEAVFDAVGRPLVDEILAGYNCTVMAYGQTGSGKTYTMLGSPSDLGVSPRTLEHLFSSLQEVQRKRASEQISVSVEVSFFEIYNEKVRDLLGGGGGGDDGGGGGGGHHHRRNTLSSGDAGSPPRRRNSHAPPSPNNNASSVLTASFNSAMQPPPQQQSSQPAYRDLKVRHTPELGTFIDGLTRIAVEEAADSMQLLTYGMDHRAMASTKMNEVSSRSHAVLQVYVKQKLPLEGMQRLAMLNLVDLAGSERIRRSGVTGQSLVEAKTINQSLSTLRRVIDILIENESIPAGKQKGVPPYRESMLTWVLSDSLGGNSKTTLVATLSPHVSNMEDTTATLRYALKAKGITCKVSVNEEKTAVVVSALKLQIEEMRRQMSEAASGSETNKAAMDDIREEITRREEEYKAALEDQQKLESIGASLREAIASKQKELDALNPGLQEKLKTAQQVVELEAETQHHETKHAQQSKELQEAFKMRLQHQERIITEKIESDALRAQHSVQLTALESIRKEEIVQKQENYAALFRRVKVIATERRNCDEMKTQISAQYSRLDDLQRVLSNKYESDVVHAREARDVMLARLHTMEQNVLMLTRTHERKIAEFDDNERELELHIEDCTTQLLRTNNELIEKRELLSIYTEEREKTSQQRLEEHFRVKSEIDHHSVELAELTMKLERVKLEVDHVKHKMARLNADLHEVDVQQLETEVIAKSNALHRKGLEIEEAEEDLLLTQGALRIVQDGIETTKTRILAIQQEATGTERNRYDLRGFLTDKLHPMNNPPYTTTPSARGGGGGRSPSPQQRGGVGAPIPSLRIGIPQDDHHHHHHHVDPTTNRSSALQTDRRSARRSEFTEELNRRGFA